MYQFAFNQKTQKGSMQMASDIFVMPGIVSGSMVCEPSMMDILMSDGVNVVEGGSWLASIFKVAKEQAIQLSNQVVMVFNNGQPIVLPTWEEDEATVANSLGLEGYNISFKDSPGVKHLLDQYPSFRLALNHIYQKATMLWRDQIPFKPNLLLDQDDEGPVLVIEFPGNVPETDADRLWELMSWRSDQDPQGVATLPVILTMGYSES